MEDWDPSIPVQALFNKIKKSADLLEAAEEPLSDKQLVRYAYDTILKTACFSDPLKTWRRKTAADKTWANFKPFMETEYDDYLEDVEANAGSAFQANSAVQDETLTVLKDIAENVSSDRTHLANLAKENATLKTLTTTLKETLSTIETQLKTITTRLTALEKTKSPSNTRNSGGKRKPTFFCWTCGINFSHGSDKCKICVPGHDVAATWTDRKNGNQTDRTTK